jgi:hypothetical protein
MRSVTATLAAVIPTRDRALLAMNAARSLLDQDCAIDIYVSDNSTRPGPLREFCERTPGVHYLRPPRQLPMSEHWDWALRQTLERSAATHFTVHYDRKLSKPRHLGSLVRTAAAHPELVISFPTDSICIEPPPRRLWQTPWTGKRYMMETVHVARLMAKGQTAEISHAIPVLSNCVVPRAALESIIARFGSVCDSAAPDSAFMWRLFALYDKYIHYDAAPGILYASHRSNAIGFLTGSGGDFADFLEKHGNRPWLDQAPIPGLNLGHNMLYHEHALVRSCTGDRLPPLDLPAVIDDLGRELRLVRNRRLKVQLRRRLEEHGWRGHEPKFPRYATPSQLLNEWRCRFHMRWRGVVPETITGFAFRSDEKALRFALKYPRHPQAASDHLAPLEGVEVSVG